MFDEKIIIKNKEKMDIFILASKEQSEDWRWFFSSIFSNFKKFQTNLQVINLFHEYFTNTTQIEESSLFDR